MLIFQVISDYDLLFALLEMVIDVFEHGTNKERLSLIVELEGLCMPFSRLKPSFRESMLQYMQFVL